MQKVSCNIWHSFRAWFKPAWWCCKPCQGCWYASYFYLYMSYLILSRQPIYLKKYPEFSLITLNVFLYHFSSSCSRIKRCIALGWKYIVCLYWGYDLLKFRWTDFSKVGMIYIGFCEGHILFSIFCCKERKVTLDMC